MPEKEKRSETELYPPVKRYLEGLGYTVRGEAAGCDIAALHNDQLIAVELKRSISLKLLSQGVERQESCDAVYLAVPAEGTGYPANIKTHLKLIKRLELGLLLVRFLQHRTRVELVCHPESRKHRRNKRRRQAILREINGRSGDHTAGGTRGKVITAYREEALFLALLLKEQGELSPAACRARGGSSKAAAILRDNHYGWFNRARHGIYRLDPAGMTALKQHKGVVDAIRTLHETKRGEPE